MSHANAPILPDSVRAAAALDPALGERLERDFARLTTAGDALVWAQRRLPALVLAGTPTRLLELLVGEAKELTGAPIGLAVSWVGDVGSGRMSFRALAGDRGQVDPAELLDPRAISRTIVGRVVQEGRPAWSDDALADARFEAAQSVQAFGLRSVGCLPIGDRGVLYLLDPARTGRFDLRSRARLSALCAQAAPFLLRSSESAPRAEPVPGLVGSSPAMQELAEGVRAFAAVPWPALILGETGTGKEAVARALHTLSPRANKPFVPVNCGAIPESLAEATLFGHEKGAFTGAARRKEGLVEQAEGGTLFLDEVGELPAPVQVGLLRLLQEGTWRRVGGDREQRFTGRIVAATWRELTDTEGRGAFREDLFYRLASCVLRVPPLRDRSGDVAAIADHLLERALAQLPGDRTVTLSPEAAALLAGRRWSGNVRELENAIKGALARAWASSGNRILPEHVVAHLQATGESVEGIGSTTPTPAALQAVSAAAEVAPASASSVGFPPELDPATVDDLAGATERYQRLVVRAALDRCEGNRTRAAGALGVTRQWLHRLITKWGGSP
mgnify:FL=1